MVAFMCHEDIPALLGSSGCWCPGRSPNYGVRCIDWERGVAVPWSETLCELDQISSSAAEVCDKLAPPMLGLRGQPLMKIGFFVGGWLTIGSSPRLRGL